MYKIIGVCPNYQNSGQTAVRIQVANAAQSFCVFLDKIYDKQWLDQFSKEDCTFLATLYVAEQKQDQSIVAAYPRKQVNITTSVLMLAIIYTGFLILANMAGSKVITLNQWITLPAVLAFFPVTYILDDIITEVYGFKISRKIIWSALIANVLVVMGAIVVVKVPPSPYWYKQEAFEAVFLASPRILCASILGYIFGEFTNSATLAKMKIHTKGKYLWLRSVLSTSVGSILDSVIFCTIGFWGELPNTVIFSMIITQYVTKIIYAVGALPIVYRLTSFLKKLDKVDTYDFNTKLNPFSL